MSSRLTDKQQAFVAWYCKLLNATRAAERAGYAGDGHSIEQQGYQLLRNIEVRSEIDRRLKESIPAIDVVMSRVSSRAHADIGSYYNADGTLDLERLKNDGLSHLVVGASVGQNGPTWSLASPQAASKLLARYHRIGADMHIDVSVSAGEDTLQALAGQLASLAEQNDDAQDNNT